MLLLSVIRPSTNGIEYGSEVWEGNIVRQLQILWHP